MSTGQAMRCPCGSLLASGDVEMCAKCEIGGYDAGDIDLGRLWEILADQPFGGERDRPYIGQAHTDLGERGKHPVSGVTMRDVGDCIARGMHAAGVPISVPSIQNALCELERLMGIYPNIPATAGDDIPWFTVADGKEPE